MSDSPKASPNEQSILSEANSKLHKVIDISREALAEKLGIKPEELPDKKFFRIVDAQLDKLEHIDPANKAKALKETLSSIRAQEVADKATELGKDGVDAAKKIAPEAMMASVKKTTEELKNKAGESGAELAGAVTAIVGAKSVDDVTKGFTGVSKAIDSISSTLSSAMKGIGELISSFMKMLGLDKFFKSVGGIFGLKFDEKKEGEKKDPKPPEEKSDVTQQKPKEIAKTVENYGEKIREKYWNSMLAEGWIKDPKNQRKEFDKLWTEYSNKMKTATKESYDMISGSKNGVLGEQIFESSQASLSFLVSLVSKGVIPTEALQVKIGEYGEKAIEIGLKSTKNLILGSPVDAINTLGQFGSSDFEHLSQAERRVILSSVHHSMAVPLYMTGIMTKALGKMALFGIYYDHGIGFTQMGSMISATAGNYEKSSKRLTELMTMLGDTHVKETQSYVNVFNSIIAESQAKTQVMQVFMNMKNSGKSGAEIIKAIESLPVDKKIIAELLGELRGAGTDIKAMSGFMSKFVSNTALADTKLGGWEKMWKSVSGTMNLTHDMQTSIDGAMDAYKNSCKRMSEVVRSDISIVRALNNARLGVSQAELIGALDKGILPIKAKDANDAKAIMDRYVRSIPKGLETFFSGLAVSITIADVWAAQPGEGESWIGAKMTTLWNDIIAMNPLVAGYKMIIEGTTMQDGKLTKIAYIGFGGLIAAVGIHDVARLIANPSWSGLSRAALGPIHTVGSTVVGMARGGRLSVEAGKAAFQPGAFRSFRTFKSLGAYGILGGIGYMYYDYLSTKNNTEDMKKAGILDQEGNIDPKKIKEGFAQLPEGKKIEAMKHIMNGMFGSDTVGIDISDDKKITVDARTGGGPQLPIGIDVLADIRETMTTLGISDPRVFLSNVSEKNIKKYIQSLPIDDAHKLEYAKNYGIDLLKS
ncbi:hypothetical protein K2X92_04060 [Candidatus Gracilibacteria bacterium]|nr:hypothetical protein [Candidatus Gracilibacteria bacterium]